MAYGYDTKSWRNSTEKRQLDRERREATAKFEADKTRDTIEVQVQCNCDHRPYPHDPEFHHKLKWPLVWLRRVTQ